MVSIYKEVEVEIDIDEYKEEILDDMSVGEIEEYLEKRRKEKASHGRFSLNEAKAALLGVAKIKLHSNLLSCKDEVKKAVNEVMNEIWM